MVMRVEHTQAAALLAGLAFCLCSSALAQTHDATLPSVLRPSDIVNASRVVERLQLDMRYAGAHNFTGRPVPGYAQAVCLLTEAAALRLASVQRTLLPMGLSLKVYDCYRPQTAVDAFAAWAADPADLARRVEFYPALDKSVLFEQGYIATRSGHTRGSTVDLTIVPLGSAVPAFDARAPQRPCTAAQAQRAPDNSLDFGSGYDCFSPMSHPDASAPNPQARANRLLLRTLMLDAGFAPLATEWWHFTLRDEPYPDSYFNFPLQGAGVEPPRAAP